MHFNPIYEELKAKAKVNLLSESNAQIYARRKIEVESVFGHIKGVVPSLFASGLSESPNGVWHRSYGTKSIESSWPTSVTFNEQL